MANHTKQREKKLLNMAQRTTVHKSGVATFPTLPNDSYTYQIDFEQHEGRLWLKSERSAREWCVPSVHWPELFVFVACSL